MGNSRSDLVLSDTISPKAISPNLGKKLPHNRQHTMSPYVIPDRRNNPDSLNNVEPHTTTKGNSVTFPTPLKSCKCLKKHKRNTLHGCSTVLVDFRRRICRNPGLIQSDSNSPRCNVDRIHTRTCNLRRQVDIHKFPLHAELTTGNNRPTSYDETRFRSIGDVSPTPNSPATNQSSMTSSLSHINQSGLRENCYQQYNNNHTSTPPPLQSAYTHSGPVLPLTTADSHNGPMLRINPSSTADTMSTTNPALTRISSLSQTSSVRPFNSRSPNNITFYSNLHSPIQSVVSNDIANPTFPLLAVSEEGNKTDLGKINVSSTLPNCIGLDLSESLKSQGESKMFTHMPLSLNNRQRQTIGSYGRFSLIECGTNARNYFARNSLPKNSDLLSCAAEHKLVHHFVTDTKRLLFNLLDVLAGPYRTNEKTSASISDRSVSNINCFPQPSDSNYHDIIAHNSLPSEASKPTSSSIVPNDNNQSSSSLGRNKQSPTLPLNFEDALMELIKLRLENMAQRSEIEFLREELRHYQNRTCQWSSENEVK